MEKYNIKITDNETGEVVESFDSNCIIFGAKGEELNITNFLKIFGGCTAMDITNTIHGILCGLLNNSDTAIALAVALELLEELKNEEIQS